MRKLAIFLGMFLASGLCHAENTLLNGGQKSTIAYEMVQEVTPEPGIRKLVQSYVIPTSFASPTFNQEISGLSIRFLPEPDKKKNSTDKRGNRVITAQWKDPAQKVRTTIALTAENHTNLKALSTVAPFPVEKLPPNVAAYTRKSSLVDSTHPAVVQKSRELVSGSLTQFDAVQKILTWLVDHMRYVLIPKDYSATYSFQTGKGNCQNYSHLAAALMRAQGMAVRIVNGITSKEPYDINIGPSVLTLKMAQGRHSWIEVFFPDLGWVPFDPQNSQMFVSNRFIRIEAGIDNEETKKDGLVRWTKVKGTSVRPRLSEHYSTRFVKDSVRIVGEKTQYGPSGLLLSPSVDAWFVKARPVVKPPAKPIEPRDPKKLVYDLDYVFGNLDFPENVDLTNPRAVEAKDSESDELARNFLVETAEYVTTKGRQYAQVFVLDRPMRLEELGLALHSFGSPGQLWVEVLEDENKMPGAFVANSNIVDTGNIPFVPGYAWVDFSFKETSPILMPGRYWIALSFTGSPVVNWFFSYGKPVGPQDGTRYKTLFDTTWSRSLAFEFNYRVRGLEGRLKKGKRK